MGFESVAAGPLVRSSYHAEQTLERAAAALRRAGTRPAGRLRGRARMRRGGRCGGRRTPIPARSDRWRPLRPAPLERTEVAAARIGRSIYVIGGFERRQRGTARPPSSATTSARDRWSRVRADADRREPPDRRRHAGRLYVHGGYAGRGLSEPTGALFELRPAHATAGGACRSSPTPRAAHAAAVIGDRLYVAGGANATGSLELDGGLRLPHAALARRPRASPGRRATTRPAWRAAALLRARPGATAATSPWPSATTRSRRRWERLPDMRMRARRASPRRGSPAGASWCSAARPGARRHHDRARSSCTTRARAAGGACRTCAPRGTGSAARRSAGASTRSRAGPSPGFHFSRRDRVPRRPLTALFPLKDDIPTRRFPVLTVAIIVVTCTLSTSASSRRLSELGETGDERVLEYGAIPYELTHPGSDCGPTADQRWSARASRAWRAAPPIRPPGGSPLFTSMFLHGSLLHLGGNMLFLWIFGNNIEDSMGRPRFVAFYLLGGLAALGRRC